MSDLYEKARDLLRAQPQLGKNRLGAMLGVKAPTARRLRERFRGETLGHSHDPDYQRLRALKEQHPEWGAVRLASELAISLDHAKLHLSRWLGARASGSVPGDKPSTPPTPDTTATPPHAGSTLEDNFKCNDRDLCYRGPQINTLEDLIVYAKVDTTVWSVERWVCNKWEMGARNPHTGEILTSPLFQIKAWFRRKLNEVLTREFADELLQKFKQEAPQRPVIHHGPRGDGMYEIAVMDLHYGKRAWLEECGHEYDNKVAARLFEEALDELLAHGMRMKPAKILLPVGNDLFHTDYLGRSTTAGTFQDSAVGWKQMFVEGWTLLARGIERLVQAAPVEVVVVNGNHDLQASFHMGEVLKAWFRTSSQVTVDNRPTPRKYVTHHKCLLGLTHGSEEKFSSLPMLMAAECGPQWSTSSPKAREYHVGHLHHKKSLMYVPAHDVAGGVLVRVIPSLTPPDSWHASKGYVSKRAAEAFYWDPECGVTATFTHSPN